MSKPDIFIFLSDQHNALFSGFAGHNIVETPNLDQIAEMGTCFDAAYTASPLCVPARMAMLSGQLPSSTGIFINEDTLSEDETTFLHSLAAEGYETVLCGRMHFKGENQRHGFTKRIMGDITSTMWGNWQHRKEAGVFGSCFGMSGCLDLIGGGTSPVLEYDKAVLQAAANYLDRDHQKPQCLVVGTYAPHFPYIAPPELFDFYKNKVKLPHTSRNKINYSNPVITRKEQNIRNSVRSGREEKVNQEIILNARAAYYGMITNLDQQIGQIKDKWDDYLQGNEREGVFIYTSDHGDTAGEHNIFGKQTFYEGSARIPLIFNGSGIKSQSKIKFPVSIMDLGPTFCQLAGAVSPPLQEGKSLVPEIRNNKENRERYVFSEFVESNYDGQTVPGRMIRQGQWKLISYADYRQFDLLFNLRKDPYELKNVIKTYPQKAQELKDKLRKDWEVKEIKKQYKVNQMHHKLLTKWGSSVNYKCKERWKIPSYAVKMPRKN